MEQISFLERIGKIFGLITSSAFFISLFAIVILTVALVIINNKVKIKIPKLFAAIGYLIIIVFIIVKYGIALYNMQDTFTDKIFSSFYFPNLITYMSILLVSIFVMILNILNKEKTLVFKVISIIAFGIIISLFVIALDIVIKNEINVYSAKSIYENTDLMIIIQASTAIFFIWMVIEIIDYFSRRIATKIDNAQKNNDPKSDNVDNQKNKTITDYSNNIKENYMNNYYNQKNKSYGNNTYNNQNYNNYYKDQNYNYNLNNYSQNSNQYTNTNYLNNNQVSNDYKKVNYLGNGDNNSVNK